MKTNIASEPVLAKKIVSWKKDQMTFSHTPQVCVGQDSRSSIPRPLTDRWLGIAKTPKRARSALKPKTRRNHQWPSESVTPTVN